MKNCGTSLAILCSVRFKGIISSSPKLIKQGKVSLEEFGGAFVFKVCSACLKDARLIEGS